MNLVLGDLGVLVAFVASLFGIITLAAGLYEDRPAVRRTARWYAWLVLGGSVLAFFAMERALITRDFDVQYVAQVGSSPHAGALQRRRPVVVAARARSCCGRSSSSGSWSRRCVKFRRRLDDQLVGLGAAHDLRRSRMFFAFLMLVAPPTRSSSRRCRRASSTARARTRCCRTTR